MSSQSYHSFEDAGIVPVQSSSGYRSTCPVCSQNRHKKDEKCVSIDMDNKIWFCHHCNFSGYIKSKPHYPIIKYKPLQKDIAMYNFFKQRGISKATVDHFHISFDGKWILFPYYIANDVVNIKYRSLDKRFKQQKGDNILRPFYNYDALSNPDIIIVEGELDVLACHESGITNAVSVPNGANLKTGVPDFIKTAERFRKQWEHVILATDNDSKGNALADELARRIGKFKCKRVIFPEGCKDANDVLIKHGKERLKELLKFAEPYKIDNIIYPDDILERAIEFKRTYMKHGLSTGVNMLDNYVKFLRGELVVVTGAPNAGKSEFMDYIMASKIRKHRFKFAIFSSENLIEEHFLKKAYKQIKEVPFSEDDIREVGKKIQRYIRFIDYEKVKTHTGILQHVEQLVFQEGIDCVLIDPYNTLEHRRHNGENETDYISRFLEDLRTFAKRHGVIVFIVAHPTKLMPLNAESVRKFEKLYGRSGKFNMPTLYSISGSANWYNKADVGFILYRFNDDITRLFIDKIRRGYLGKLGWVDFEYDKARWSFRPIAHGNNYRQHKDNAEEDEDLPF